MKTVKQWLETLQEPYRSKALKNMTADEDKRDSLSSAIRAAFVWSATEEGFDYWDEVHLNILKGRE